MTERVLVVDDEQSVLSFCSRSLERQGYEVRTALSAAEALDLVQRESFDLVATDVGMPGMSGLELAQEALAICSDLAVIIMTGMASLDVSVQAIRAGAQDFLAKPFSMGDLVEAAQSALNRVRTARERDRLGLLLPLLELWLKAMDGVTEEKLCRLIVETALARPIACGAAVVWWHDDRRRCYAQGALAGATAACRRYVRREALGSELDIRAPSEPNDRWLVRYLLRHDIRALAVVPIESCGASLGALLVGLAKRPDEIDRAERAMLCLLGAQAGGLLENMLLSRDLQAWQEMFAERVGSMERGLDAEV